MIECGNSPEFHRQLTADPTAEALAASQGGTEVVGVRAKILKVRETKVLDCARGCRADYISQSREPVRPSSTRALQWTTYNETAIQPHGQRELILQLVIAIKAGEKRSYIVRPAVLEDSPSEFTLEI